MGKLLLAIWVFLGSFIGVNYQPSVQHTARQSASPVIILTPIPTYTPGTLLTPMKFFIKGGSGTDVYDAKMNKILKPTQFEGYNMISLDPSLNGRTAELPIGTKIFVDFTRALTSGSYKVSINPEKGIVEFDEGLYTSPKDKLWLLKVVNQGTATITVTKTSQ
jgi:hypothetical protein